MTDDFDDAIRSRLHQAGPPPSGAAHAALGELRPAMRRARIKRSLAVGTATLSLLGVAGLGVVAITASADPADVGILDGERLPEPTPPVPTTEADGEVDDATVQSTSPAIDATTTTSEPEPTTTRVTSTVAPTSTAPAVTQETAPTPSESVPQSSPSNSQAPPTTNEPVPTTPTTSVPSTTVAPPTTPAPGTTSPPTTGAPPASGQQTISSNCGSITVSYIGNDISLVGTQPGAGFSFEVKDSGPDEVKVEFDNGGAECEIEAWMESGTLRFDVENDDGDDGDDD